MNALNHDLEGFSKGEGEEAVEHYSELRESVRNGARLFLNPFIAQMMREQSPILPEDVLPRLLSEDIETIRTALPLLNPNTLASLQQSVKRQLEVTTHILKPILSRNPNFFAKTDMILAHSNN